MSKTKRRSALEQDAYKILCQLKIKELEPRIFQTALSFAIGSGDQHLLIGLMRKYPELIGQDSVFSKAVYESIRLNPDTAESLNGLTIGALYDVVFIFLIGFFI